MICFFYNNIKSTFLLIFSVFLVLISNSINAENLENVLQDIERIEKDLSDLQKQVYREKKSDAETASDINDNSAAIFDIRIRDIESQISELTAYVEDYVFKIDELNEKINDLLLMQSQNLIQNNNNVEQEIKEDDFSNNEDQSLGTLELVIPEDNENIVNFENDILPDVSPDEQYQFAFDLLRDQKLIEARKALEEFISKNPDHSLSGSANYWIGEIIYLSGNYKEAALTFAEAYQKYPASLKVPDMLLRLSKSLSKIDKSEQACITLNELITNYPDSKLIKKAETEKKLIECQ
ncbi:MAG: tol-pal system protein YbgF [Pelagibacteraceae bacterium]|nr:tol-pal system protein YbgF [Pelagibacteraceae bacterium]|tara:strand:+ start:50 stop:931 length:882 start_codon:yes stop_codon:yes gene_type:complete